MAITQKSTGEMVLTDATECSRCGCKDIRSYGGVKKCRNCGKPWVRRLVPKQEPEIDDTVDPRKPVRYQKTCCPWCGSGDAKVTRTARPKRWHKCRTCDKSFTSEE